jgi:hypothetical protein
MMKAQKFIGIDPGKNTGIAIAINGKLSELIMTNFWGAVAIIEQNIEAVIVIELPMTRHVWHDKAKTKGAIQGTARRVGSVIREAELLVEYLKIYERTYITQTPQGKKTREQFQRITGWAGSTNSHTRDAGLLIHGLLTK